MLRLMSSDKWRVVVANDNLQQETEIGEEENTSHLLTTSSAIAGERHVTGSGRGRSWLTSPSGRHSNYGDSRRQLLMLATDDQDDGDVIPGANYTETCYYHRHLPLNSSFVMKTARLVM